MDDLGTKLPQRRGVALVLAGGGLALTVPTVRAFSAAARTSGPDALAGWAMAVLMTLLLVLLPLLLARDILRRRTFVSDDAVTTMVGGTVRRRVAFSAVREVRARHGSKGFDTVELVGEQPTDRVLVSLVHVATLRPLFDRLDREVAERPELLTSDGERDDFSSVRSRAR